MGRLSQDTIVVGRLRGLPILTFVFLSLSFTGWTIWETFWGYGFIDSMYHSSFGDLLGPLAIIIGLAATFWFGRMWKDRSSYLRYDSRCFHRGSEASWPIASIRDVVVTRNVLGIRSVRIRLSSSEQPELAKAYMLVEDADKVCAEIARGLGISHAEPS